MSYTTCRFTLTLGTAIPACLTTLRLQAKGSSQVVIFVVDAKAWIEVRDWFCPACPEFALGSQACHDTSVLQRSRSDGLLNPFVKHCYLFLRARKWLSVSGWRDCAAYFCKPATHVQADDETFVSVRDAIVRKFLDVGFSSHHNKFGLVLYGTVRFRAESFELQQSHTHNSHTHNSPRATHTTVRVQEQNRGQQGDDRSSSLFNYWWTEGLAAPTSRVAQELAALTKGLANPHNAAVRTVACAAAA